MEIRGITVAVGDWYARALAVTLPANMRHFASCLVVTKPGDACVEVARSVPGVDVLETDAFTRHGAFFNKGLAFEEGFDRMGRRGWIAIHDADILLPDRLDLARLHPDGLNGCRRRIVEPWPDWDPAAPWSTYPLRKDGGPIGFCQIFRAECPALAGKRPWYDVTFPHAGGGDAYFLTHWPGGLRRVLPFDALHLGPVDRHWFGTEPDAIDRMARFVIENGWGRAARLHDPTAIDRVPELVERVEVPGYEPTGFELPFVCRAKARKARNG